MWSNSPELEGEKVESQATKHIFLESPLACVSGKKTEANWPWYWRKWLPCGDDDRQMVLDLGAQSPVCLLEAQPKETCPSSDGWTERTGKSLQTRLILFSPNPTAFALCKQSK